MACPTAGHRQPLGGPDGRRVGFHFRNVTEPILVGVKGRMRTLQPGRSTVSMIEAHKREHSRKPDKQHDLIEACSPGSYAELFGCYTRPGRARGETRLMLTSAHKELHARLYWRRNSALVDRGAHERMNGWVADHVSAALAHGYEMASSVQQLAQRSGYSITRVRTLVARRGVE